MIYLEPEDRIILTTALNKLKFGDVAEYWRVKSLLSKVQSDSDRIEDISKCTHSMGDYVGKKHCCKKCGQLINIQWDLVDK